MQQRDRSGGKTARDYSAGTSVIRFQIFFQCITEEGVPSWRLGEAYERTGRMKALYSWERNSLKRPHDAEAMERSALKREKNFVRKDWT